MYTHLLLIEVYNLFYIKMTYMNLDMAQFHRASLKFRPLEPIDMALVRLDLRPKL